MYLVHDRIWSCGNEGDLMPRAGQLHIDPLDAAELFEAPPHILHVDGLESQDFAVFFEAEAFGRQPLSHGYLVSQVVETGEGILILGDALEADPRSWMTPRIEGMIKLLGEEQLAEFSLESLYHHVTRTAA